MKEVYVVMSVVDMSDCVDSYGESAGDFESIHGIFGSIEKAIAKKAQLEQENEPFDDDCNCNSTYYRIDTWEVR